MKLTNKQYSEQDLTFKRACELANVKPTSRQASKFRNNRIGQSRHYHKQAALQVAKELEAQRAAQTNN